MLRLSRKVVYWAATAVVIAASHAAPPVVNGPAFSENFDDPKLPNWATNGTFAVSGGKLTLGNPRHNRENTWVYVKIPAVTPKAGTFTPYTNFSVEMRARLVSDPKTWGGYGLWFRTNGGGQYRNGDMNPEGGAGYVFNYAPGIKGVGLFRRSHSVQIAGPPKSAPIDANWHTLRVDAVGPHLVAWLDGQKMFDCINPELPFGYANGAVGIGVLNRGSVEVDTFKITPMGAAPVATAAAKPGAGAKPATASKPAAKSVSPKT